MIDIRSSGDGGIINRVLFQRQGDNLPSGYSINTTSANGGNGVLNNATVTLQSVGSGQSFDNRLSYYELAYIIKL
mgnify:CR=1 FL=1